MPERDEGEAAHRRCADARFRQGDAGIWVRPDQLSALVQGGHLGRRRETLANRAKGA
jgi:hypothetical protein